MRNPFGFLMKPAQRVNDQQPVISTVGRGPKGNSFRIGLESDSSSSTHLAGYEKDGTTGQETKVWESGNVNGGELSISVAQQTEAIPPTFTMTFTYNRAGRNEWAFTTPAIPYIPE
jgi:hypothetical protein